MVAIKDLLTQRGKQQQQKNNIWKEGGGASERHWILMRNCQRCENKFKVTLASKWPPGCSQGGCWDPWTLALISCWKKGCWSFTVSGVFPFAGLTPDASRLPLHTDAPMGTCIYAVKTGRVKTGLHTAGISERHHGCPRTTENRVSSVQHAIGCWRPQSVCVLERVALLPNGALATARLQLRVLHLLNIRWYPGEEVQKLIIVDGIGVSKLLSEFVYAPD